VSGAGLVALIASPAGNHGALLDMDAGGAFTIQPAGLNFGFRSADT
jgi:hypothetical protein